MRSKNTRIRCVSKTSTPIPNFWNTMTMLHFVVLKSTRPSWKGNTHEAIFLARESANGRHVILGRGISWVSSRIFGKRRGHDARVVRRPEAKWRFVISSVSVLDRSYGSCHNCSSYNKLSRNNWPRTSVSQ